MQKGCSLSSFLDLRFDSPIAFHRNLIGYSAARLQKGTVVHNFRTVTSRKWCRFMAGCQARPNPPANRKRHPRPRNSKSALRPHSRRSGPASFRLPKAKFSLGIEGEYDPIECSGSQSVVRQLLFESFARVLVPMVLGRGPRRVNLSIQFIFCLAPLEYTYRSNPQVAHPTPRQVGAFSFIVPTLSSLAWGRTAPQRSRGQRLRDRAGASWGRGPPVALKCTPSQSL